MREHNDVTEAERDAAAAPAGTPVSKWAIHRRMYDWVLSLAHKKHATSALFLLSFAESSFFPIPPDVLLMPLCLGNRKKAFYFATVCTIASVIGGIFGFYIGHLLWDAIAASVFQYGGAIGFTEKNFNTVRELYQQNAFWAVFTAAFTPIPYKVFTVAGGVFEISLFTLIIASIIGRGLRFYLVAGLMWLFGPPIVKFIDKYFNLMSIAFTVLLIGGFVGLKYLKAPSATQPTSTPATMTAPAQP